MTLNLHANPKLTNRSPLHNDSPLGNSLILGHDASLTKTSKFRGKSLVQNSLNTTMRESKSKRTSPKRAHDTLTKTTKPGDAGARSELLTPTSISMKNAFIIKNADTSFDHYFTQMRRRKGYAGSPTRIPHHGGSPDRHNTYQPTKVKIVLEKQPTGRDGHSAFLFGSKWIIFGGDRHHMPYNDTYVLDLAKLILD